MEATSTNEYGDKKLRQPHDMKEALKKGNLKTENDSEK